MSILATCLTIAALSATAPAEPIRLEAQCGELVLKAPAPVTIEAEGSTVRGLRLRGNIRWKGGVLSAPEGLDGFAAGGYAVHISGAGNSLFSARVVNAKKGVVIDKADRTTIAYTDFIGLREDGIIASEARGVSFYSLRFAGSQPKPSQCVSVGKITYSVPQRDCVAPGDRWTDGNHPDAIQMRNGVTDATISNVMVSGATAGITQMDTKGDAPLARVEIRHSLIQAGGFYNLITLDRCQDCTIRENTVLPTPGIAHRAVIIAGTARRCGNFAPDDRTIDAPC